MYRHNRLFAPDCETMVFTLLRCGITYMHILYPNIPIYTLVLIATFSQLFFYFLEQSSPLQHPVAEGPSLGLLTFDILPEMIPV